MRTRIRSPLSRPIILAAALLVGAAMDASAQTAPGAASQIPGPQIATLPPPETAPPSNAITLPEVTVTAPQNYLLPHSSGGGPRASSYSIPRTEHYPVLPGDAANPAFHPYSSGLGPRASSMGTVRAEHFEVPPDYDGNVSMHPYTSGLGPCLQGGTGKVVCGDMVPPSRYNRKPDAEKPAANSH